MIIKENYSLKKLNTFGIAAFAEKFVEIQSYDELLNSDLISNHESEIFILGGGSNVLLSRDVKGLVIKNGIETIKILENNRESVTLEIGGGVIWDDLVRYAVDNEFYGIENLSFIPGTVGAAPIQNIGAYGVEFESVFSKLNGINLLSGEEQSFNKELCKFGYRDSIFKHKFKNQFFITSVIIKLNKHKKLNTNYRAINDFINENNIDKSKLTLKDLREIIIAIRKSKLPNPSELGNAGSFFKNPIVEKDIINSIKIHHKDIVFFKISENLYKISAGWLIEKIGYKGKRVGNVGVHKNQALVLVNYGGAKGEEIISLAEEIKHRTFDKFNINLEFEVNII